MSGLAAVLAGRHPTGVHRWESGLEVDDVRHAVEAAGWTFRYADGVAAESLPAVLALLGAALALPAHYGRNLDALNDCLRDLDGPTVLLWEGWGAVARADPRGFGVVSEVLGVRGPQDPRIEVLLRGPGPEDAAALLA